MFEVSPRTIYRDIDAINMAGIPVRGASGVGGGFEIMQKYKIDKQVFSTADLSALLMGLSSLSNMIRSDELVNALAKVKSFIPADKVNDIELKANQIDIDLSPWMGNRNIQPYLEIIKTALQESRLLTFEYTDRYGNKTARTVEPYQLVLKSSHWYWQGYCHKRNDYRLFRLSRISKAIDEFNAYEKRVIDVALDYGFSSHANFTRAFKKTYGITPEEYKKNRPMLNTIVKPEISMNYVLIDEGVPLLLGILF